MFNPIGGPGHDLCAPDPTNLPSTCTAASLAQLLEENVPIKPVLAFPPQPITSPLATEAADSSFTGIDFVPASFVRGPVQPGAALYALQGDFGFSAPNATEPAHEVGHELKLINFSPIGKPLELSTSDFAHNNTFDQAFVTEGVRGWNRRPTCGWAPTAAPGWRTTARCATSARAARTVSSWVPPTDRSADSGHRRDLPDPPTITRAIPRAGWLLPAPPVRPRGRGLEAFSDSGSFVGDAARSPERFRRRWTSLKRWVLSCRRTATPASRRQRMRSPTDQFEWHSACRLAGIADLTDQLVSRVLRRAILACSTGVMVMMVVMLGTLRLNSPCLVDIARPRTGVGRR